MASQFIPKEALARHKFRPPVYRSIDIRDRETATIKFMPNGPEGYLLAVPMGICSDKSIFEREV